ncbi:MAG: glycine--tRNA ligase subunit beta [Caldilineaceae bacterium]
MLLGHFEERYLDLPMAVLIGVMKKHQRYFPVFGQGGGETQANSRPYFVTVANSNNLAQPDVVSRATKASSASATPMRLTSIGRTRPSRWPTTRQAWVR